MTTRDGTRNDFLCAYLEDLEAGRTRTREEYRAMFPGAEDEIEEELSRLEDGRDDERAAEATTFGDYRLIRELGRGGQGTVYLAEDQRLERRVALKVLARLPLEGAESRRRFEREARVASRIDDSGICTVHETGVVGGTPFIAMRYVAGETLQQKVARARRTGREVGPAGEVASLFERIAGSLHRAHEAGIVHRDIKPGNIMMSADGDPVLLDFGLARAQDEVFPTLTRTGDLFGTPAYMAPELLSRGPSADRSVDVYALGVTLYECLTLQRPFTAPTREALYREILDSEPLDPLAVRSRMSADLRLILLTAVAKDPARRYRTAADLAEDLRRFRVSEPILARAPSAVYRARRFVARHRVVVGATALVVLGLSAATAITGAALVEARDERAVAEESLRSFEDILTSASHGNMGRDVRLLEVLDSSAERLADTLSLSPDAGARLSGAVGRVYAGLGEYGKADELFLRAHEMLSARHGDTDARALAVLQDLGRLRLLQARFDESERHFTLVAEERRRELGPDHEDTLHVMLDFGALRTRQGELGAAQELLEDVRERATGDLVHDVLFELSELRQEQGRWQEALDLQRDVLRRLEQTRGPDDTDTARARSNLAVLYMELERYDEAEPLFDQALAVDRAKVGLHAPRTIVTASNLALLYKHQGRFEDAERLYVDVLEDQERALSAGHPHTLDTANDLGRLYQATGRLEEAERFLRRAYEGGRLVQGDDHPKTLTYRNNLGLVLHDAKRLDEAAVELEGALAGREVRLAPDHPETLKSVNNLAYLRLDQGRIDEAQALFERSLEGRRRVRGEEHPDTIKAIVNLGWFHDRQGRVQEAAVLYREALEVCHSNDEALGATRALPQRLLASAELRLGRPREAAELAEELLARLSEEHPDRPLVQAILDRARASD